MYITAGANTLGPANFYFGNSTANTTAVNTIIGSITNVANTTTVQGGNGTAAISITPQTTGTIVIGASAGTGAITLGSSSTTQTVNIGTGAGLATINLGTGNAASVVTVGGATGLNTLTVTGVATLNNPVLIGTGTPSSSTFWRGDGTWASASSAGWGTTGNTGTTASTSAIGTAANNNFIGTTDAKDFVIASNNRERMRVLSAGLVTIGLATTTTVAGSATNPSPLLEIAGNTATSSLKVGTIEFQSFAINNSFFGDNLLYGSGGFVRRAAGYGSLFYFNSNEGQFRLASSSTAGSALTEGGGFGLIPFKVNITGTGAAAVGMVAMGGSIANNGDSAQSSLTVFSNITTTAVPVITGKFTLHKGGAGALGTNGSAGVFYTAPTVAGGTNAGTPTIVGTNTDGRITITPTGTTAASATLATVTYSAVLAGITFQYPNGSVVTLTPGNAATAALTTATQVYTNGSATTFTITNGTTGLTSGTTYIWNYRVGGY
jgi:hypothetical protein